jgi:hypothetical protein
VTSKRNEHAAENNYRSNHVGGSWPERSFGAHGRMVALSPETRKMELETTPITRNLNDGSRSIAFSSEVRSGSRKENASKQKIRASVLIQSEPKWL